MQRRKNGLVTRTLAGAATAAFVAALFLGATAGTAAAQDEDDAATRPEHPKLQDYKATGETQMCVNTSRIRRSEVLDDYTILFHMRNGRIFVNRLPHRCFGLGFERGFGYSLSTSLLCDVDIIQVIEPSGMGAHCGLGEFERLVKKDDGKKKKKKKDQTDEQSEDTDRSPPVD